MGSGMSQIMKDEWRMDREHMHRESLHVENVDPWCDTAEHPLRPLRSTQLSVLYPRVLPGFKAL
jgi:hypothetical protein